MKQNRFNSIALAMVMSASMSGGLLTSVTQEASAATSVIPGSVVTIPEPGMQSLDPAAWGAQILLDQGTVLEGLVGYNLKSQIVPKIATRWTTSKNGLIWTFYLRNNARWSNGKPVTASDFYYAWMRFLNPANTGSPMWATFLSDVVGANAYHANTGPAGLVGLKVINPYEIQIHLQSPMPDLIDYMAIASAMPLYAPSVQAHPTNWFLPQYFVGDGPYAVKSFVPNGEIQLIRNPYYVGNQTQFNAGNVAQINIVPTPSTPLESYMANNLSVAQIGNPSDYQYIKGHTTLLDQLHQTYTYQVNSMAFDKSLTASPLDNQLVRQAISMSINRYVLTHYVLNGMATPATVFGPPDWPSAKLEHGVTESVPAALKLLAKAGYPNGRGIPTIYFYTPPVGDPSIPVAEGIAQQLKQNLGINVKIAPTPWSLLGGIIWGGYNKGIKPGFNLFTGVVNWWAASSMDMQSVFATWYDYPPAYRDHVANAVLSTSNPYSVAKYGNPTDTKLGLVWSSWIPLQKAYLADTAFLTKYIANVKDPVYKQTLIPDPSWSSQWNAYVAQWKAAKTDAAKNAAWVSAWNFIGGPSGLDLQVWEDQHRPSYALNWNILAAHESDATLTKAIPWGAKLGQSVINSGYMIPLYVPKFIYLVKPGLTNVVVNKFAYGNFFQLQYLTKTT